MDQIAVVPLGISAGTPTRDRHVSSTAVVLDGRVVLFDCGEGTQYQLMRAPFRWSGLELVCVTHLHGDHVYGLPGLLGTMTLHGREEPLTVCGPPGLRAYLEGVFETTRLRRAYPLEIVEVGEGFSLPRDGYAVRAARLEHSVPTFAFLLVEDDRPGRFDVAAARALGVPDGPLFGRLQAGEDIDLLDGKRVAAAGVTGAPRPGRRIAYCLDTRPCDAAVELARGASILIHEATYGEDLRDEAAARAHSTAAEAAEVAKRAGAARLLLTHFSPRYTEPEILAAEARRIFTMTDAARELQPVPLRTEP
ncbi:MAG: ribonuclease Z [Thermoanaerobaculia bacterium]